MNQQDSKNEYTKAISLFLAELLRTRRISLLRASEIAQKVLENINLINTEQQFLEFVKILTSDFEELHHFVDLFHMHVIITEQKDLEQKVRAFVIQTVSSDIDLANEILLAAVDNRASLEDLYAKFPTFKDFVMHHHFDSMEVKTKDEFIGKEITA